MLSIEEELKSIKDRLAVIEDRLMIKPAKTSPPDTSPSEKNIAESDIKATSGNLLGIVAIICFILAAGFIIKLSIDSGWLTPARQIFISTLFGLILIGSGIKLLELDREYASYLPATGIIVLYLSAIAAYRFYSLIAFDTSLAIVGGISFLCVGLYLRIRHDIYPITAAVGAYFAPIIIDLQSHSTFTLYYFVICSLTFSYLSVAIQSRILTLVAAYSAIFATTILGLEIHANQLIAQILALHFIIYALGVVVYSKYLKTPLTEPETWHFFPVLLLFYISEYYFIELINPDAAAWLSMAFAIFLIGLYLITKEIMRGKHLASWPMIVTFSAIVFFHAGYISLLPEQAGPWLFIALMLTMAFYLPDMDTKAAANRIPIKVLGILVLVIVGIEYLRIFFDLLNDSNDIQLPAEVLAIISMWVLFIRRESYLSTHDIYGYSLLGAAHFLVILTLYNQTHAISSLAVSASWLVYGIAIIAFAFVRKDQLMANSALFVLGLAAIKALLYDAASTPTIVRIVCLLLTGVVLYLAGYLFRIIATWKNTNV